MVILYNFCYNVTDLLHIVINATMIRITDAVKQIVEDDAFAIEAMQRNLLNLSAYAQEILPLVERMTMKPVRPGTIVVALARMAATIGDRPLSPHITIDNFSVTSNLQVISYARTHAVSQTIKKGITASNENQFFTLTEGIHEVTIICSDEIAEQVKSHFSEQPVSEMENLVAVSIRFSDEYISVPNTIYALVGALALRHINILEIVSTYTELTFVVSKDELEATIQALQTYTQK